MNTTRIGDPAVEVVDTRSRAGISGMTCPPRKVNISSVASMRIRPTAGPYDLPRTSWHSNLTAWPLGRLGYLEKGIQTPTAQGRSTKVISRGRRRRSRAGISGMTCPQLIIIISIIITSGKSLAVGCF